MKCDGIHKDGGWFCFSFDCNKILQSFSRTNSLLKRVNMMEGELCKLAFLDLTAVLARIIMSEKQNAIEFTITTSRDQLVDKTIEEIRKHTYLDPLFDAAFKAFLSDEEALINFLNGVFHLKKENKIESVVIKNSEINVIFPVVKSFRLDIRATTSNGLHINIEMQKAKPDYFVDRVLLQHSAFMLQSKYEWDQLNFGNLPSDLTKEQRATREIHRYEVPPTYAIWICDFPISEQKSFRGDWAVRDKEGLTLSDKMMYIDVYDISGCTRS